MGSADRRARPPGAHHGTPGGRRGAGAGRRDRPRALAEGGNRAGGAGRGGDVSERRLDRARRALRRAPVPPDGRRRAGGRRGARRRRVAGPGRPSGRRSQGGPPREPDGDDRRLPGRHPADRGRGERRCAERLRPPGTRHARAAEVCRRERSADGRGRDGDGFHGRGGPADRVGRGRVDGGRAGRAARRGTDAAGPRAARQDGHRAWRRGVHADGNRAGRRVGWTVRGGRRRPGRRLAQRASARMHRIPP